MFESSGFLNERRMTPFPGSWEIRETSQRRKKEHEFDTDATESRTKAKRMFELLNPILPRKGFIVFVKNLKSQTKEI